MFVTGLLGPNLVNKASPLLLYCPLSALLDLAQLQSVLQLWPSPLPLSPAGHVLEEEDECDADADEAERHGREHHLLQAVEQLLLRPAPRRQQLHALVVQVLKLVLHESAAAAPILHRLIEQNIPPRHTIRKLKDDTVC